MVVGTTTGTITDFDGNYSVELPAGSKQLQFSYIGYASQTVNVSANVLNIRLKSDTEMLSDVVVIGYGTQRKSDLTGSVTNVSSEDFNTGLVSSPEQLINGKSPVYRLCRTVVRLRQVVPSVYVEVLR